MKNVEMKINGELNGNNGGLRVAALTLAEYQNKRRNQISAKQRQRANASGCGMPLRCALNAAAARALCLPQPRMTYLSHNAGGCAACVYGSYISPTGRDQRQ